jgi:hypothetical protein
LIKGDGPKRTSLETGHAGGALLRIDPGNAQLRISNNGIECTRFRTGSHLFALSAHGGGEQATKTILLDGYSRLIGVDLIVRVMDQRTDELTIPAAGANVLIDE